MRRRCRRAPAARRARHTRWSRPVCGAGINFLAIGILSRAFEALMNSVLYTAMRPSRPGRTWTTERLTDGGYPAPPPLLLPFAHGVTPTILSTHLPGHGSRRPVMAPRRPGPTNPARRFFALIAPTPNSTRNILRSSLDVHLRPLGMGSIVRSASRSKRIFPPEPRETIGASWSLQSRDSRKRAKRER